MTHKTKHSKHKNTGCSIYCGSSYGPTSGSEHDFYIAHNCNTNNTSHSNGNVIYELPPGVNAKTYLAGNYAFKVKEIEVYLIIVQ